MNDKMIQPETDSFFDEIANNFTNVSNDYRTIKISIKSSDWVSTITKLKDEHGLIFFSWLSAVDWTNEVVTGEPPKDKVEECFEILCCLSDIEYGNLVIVSTKIDKKKFAEIADDRFTVSDKIDYLLTNIGKGEKVSFKGLFREASTKGEVLVTFLALLELIRLKEFQVRQKGVLGEIELTRSNLDQF